jgi:hypothetical protein
MMVAMKTIALHSFGFIGLIVLVIIGWSSGAKPPFWIAPGVFAAILGWNLFWDLKLRDIKVPPGQLMIRGLVPKLILVAGMIALGVFNGSPLLLIFGFGYLALILFITAIGLYAVYTRRSNQ